MNPLTEAIDAAVAYVRAHPERMSPAELDEFQRLAKAVYLLAHAAGVGDAIPRVPDLAPQLESDELRLPPVQYESALRLPGDWDRVPPSDDDGLPVTYSIGGDDPPPTPERAFLVCASRWWYEAMDLLRSRGEAAEPEGRAADAGAPPLSKEQEKILLYLLNHDPCLRQELDIATGIDLSRGTVNRNLAVLRARGWVHRPEGERRGNCLTDEGRRVAQQTAEHPGPADG